MEQVGYIEQLRALCDKTRPSRILEFGTGRSTALFAEYGKVTCVEYNPPGNWMQMSSPNVDFKLVEHEEGVSPRNLIRALFELLISGPLTRMDVRQDCRLHTDPMPWWDLAYVDGAVHSHGEPSVRPPLSRGWCGGDASYVARCTFFGACLPFAKMIVMHDLQLMPMLRRVKMESHGQFVTAHRG